MKIVNYNLISSGVYTKGDYDVFLAMQDYYKSTIEAHILNKIGSYDTSKYYVFGDSTATYSKTIGGDNIIQAGSKNIAYKNGVFYTLDTNIIANETGSKLSEELTQTSKLFSDNVSRDFITEYRLIQDNTTGTITGNDIVPLFIYDITSDWVEVPRVGSGGTGKVYVMRQGVMCYLRGSSSNGSGTGSDVYGQVPLLFRPYTNVYPPSEAVQQFLVVETSTFENYQIYNDGSIICNANTGFIIINGAYSLI